MLKFNNPTGISVLQRIWFKWRFDAIVNGKYRSYTTSKYTFDLLREKS